MQRIRIARLAMTGAAAAAVLVAPAALAQTSVQRSSTTFVIHDAKAPEGERVAMPGEPMLAQGVTATRAARLETEAPSLLGPSQVKVFPEGTTMFGVQVPDGWIYCAVSKSSSRFWFGDATACYQDSDEDGRFDMVRNSGAPFQGVPLFVFQPGPPRPLPAPVKYSPIPYGEGPRIEIALTWKPIGPRRKEGEPFVPTNKIAVSTGLLTGEQNVSIYRDITVNVGGSPTQKVRQNGAELTILGYTPEGGLRYRVDRTMPAQVEPMEMQITTSTYYYVVSY